MKARFKWLAGHPVSVALYYLGHGLSLLMNAWEPLGHLYPVYNRLMLASCDVDEWAGEPRIWEKPETCSWCKGHPVPPGKPYCSDKCTKEAIAEDHPLIIDWLNRQLEEGNAKVTP